MQRPRLEERLGGRPSKPPPSPHRLTPPFFASSASVDEDAIDIDSHFQENGDACFSAVADDDKMRSVTEEMIRVGNNTEIEMMLTSFNQGTPVAKPIRARGSR